MRDAGARLEAERVGEGRPAGRRSGARGELIGRGLDAAALPFTLLFAVPYAGRALKWLWSLLLTGIWGLVALPGVALWLAGVRWEKKLPVRVIVLRDETGQPVVAPEELEPHLEGARELFLSAVGVRLLFGDPAVEVAKRPSRASVLEPGCHTVWSFVEDLGRRGSAYELVAGAAGGFRRLVGYGAPVVVVVVRGFTTRHIGCSLGPLTDYVTVKGANATCIAHELGHACGLPHSRSDDNLMYRSCGRTAVRRWQGAVIRSSRHVTTL
jgi:hypothetical protein